MQKQKQKKSSGIGGFFYVILALFFILGGEIFVLIVPLLIIGAVVYVIIKVGKKRKNTGIPVQHQPQMGATVPQQRPQPQPVRATPQPVMDNRPVPKPKMTTGIDYGQRHRENAKRMLDAGLITQEEYRMQLQRSNSL